jgi:hypothetical protein
VTGQSKAGDTFGAGVIVPATVPTKPPQLAREVEERIHAAAQCSRSDGLRP